jgi:[protein-PII] uridylyltransferase
LVKSVESALSSKEPPRLPSAEPARARTTAFEVAPSVAVADRASTRTTVVEINAHDRPALLAALAAAVHAQGHQIHSAHIATYGERAVDVFYLTRADGKKLEADDVDALKAALLQAAAEPAKAQAA